MDSLKYTSVIALISIGYLVIFVAAHFLKGDTMEDIGPIRVIRWESAVATLSTFPVLVFAYTCHQNVGFDQENPDLQHVRGLTYTSTRCSRS